MKANINEQHQECFETDFDVANQLQSIQLRIDIKKKINSIIPANQLRTARRPDHMAPRTFYLDRPFHLLPDILNHPSEETLTEVQTNKIKDKIQNTKNLSLEQYFNQKNFRLIYNKLQTYRNYNKSFIGKLKGIDSLIDYNWKFFKELQHEKKSYSHNRRDIIDSDFQSGNICRAYLNVQESQDREYHLLIENDLNTYGYNNWFFFRFKNREAGNRKFVIANFIKKTKFYDQGMLISIFSMKKYQYRNTTWFKGGNNITFQTINILRYNHQRQYYNSLYFQYNFQYDNDDVYFAMNQPYTYSRLIKFIKHTQLNIQDLNVQVKHLCFSIANNIIPSIRFYRQEGQASNVVLILARQHPCETVGSFIAESLMNLFKHQSTLRQSLFQSFQFIIIPMVNPDGVIHGMSRTNMSGLDLNRQWGQNSLKQLTPETIKIKQYILSLQKTKNIKYMIDLHGHGKKLNTFFFCCKSGQKQNYRLLSLCLNKLEQRFNIFNCTYGLTKDKENTIRSQLNNVGINQCYTLETSLYGWKRLGEIIHFNQRDYQNIAKRLLESIFLIEGNQEVTQKYFGFQKDSIMTDYSNLIQKIEKTEMTNTQNQDMLSDSDPQGDILDMKDLLGKCENKILKKKILDSLNQSKKFQFRKNRKLSTLQNFKNEKESLIQKKQMSNKLLQNFTKYYDHEKELRKSGVSQFPTNHQNQKNLSQSKWIVKRKDAKSHMRTQQKQKVSDMSEELNMITSKLSSKIKTQTTTHKSNRLKTIIYKHFQDKAQRPRMKLRQRLPLKSTEAREQTFVNKSERFARLEDLSSHMEARYGRIMSAFNETIPVLKIKQKTKDSVVILQTKEIQNIFIAHKKESLLKKYEEEGNNQQSTLSKQQSTSKIPLDPHILRGNQIKKLKKQTSNMYHYPIF